MAESWRTPHPYQQNQGGQPVFQYQQQGPGGLSQLPQLYSLPPPSPHHTGLPGPMASCSAPTCTFGGGTPMRRHGRSNQMTPLHLSQLYAPALAQPPLESLLRFLLQGPDVPSPSGTRQEPLASTSNLGGQVQTGPSQEGSWGNVNPGPQSSQYLMQASLEVQTPTTAQAPPQEGNLQHNARADMLPLRSPDPSSATEDSEDQRSASYSPTSPSPAAPGSEMNLEYQNEGHLSVQALAEETRDILEQEYGVCPEIVEGYLWNLPDGEPTQLRHDELVKNLCTLLHPVPHGPFRRLMRSYPIILRKRLHRIRQASYVIRKAENKKLQREHMKLTEKETLSLRNQVQELTQAKDAL
ncbi:uncharacterized protein LOC117264547 [Epinephelus lanceolatus]